MQVAKYSICPTYYVNNQIKPAYYFSGSVEFGLFCCRWFIIFCIICCMFLKVGRICRCLVIVVGVKVVVGCAAQLHSCRP